MHGLLFYKKVKTGLVVKRNWEGWVFSAEIFS